MRKEIFALTAAMLITGSFPTYGVEQAPTSVPPTSMQKELSPEEQIKAIDKELAQLEKQLEKKRMEAFNTQIEAQGLLQTQWEAYIQKIIEADRQTDSVKAIEKQMHEMQAKKKEIIENQYRRKK